MSVHVVSRAQWGAKAWQGSPAKIPLSRRTEFFVHYHGHAPRASVGIAVPREVEAIHLANGWAGTGYNFMVDQNGVAYEGRGWGLQGSHCPNHNVTGIGVYVAVGDDQTPSDAALNTVRALYDEACLKTGHNLAKKGHRDGKQTACPGDKLYSWVHRGMPVHISSAPPLSTAKPAAKPPLLRWGWTQVSQADINTRDTVQAVAVRSKVSSRAKLLRLNKGGHGFALGSWVKTRFAAFPPTAPRS